MIKNLSTAAEDEGIPLVIWHPQDLVLKIRLYDVTETTDVRTHQASQRIEVTCNDAERIDIAVGEFEVVEVTAYNQTNLRIGVLQILHFHCNRLGLQQALHPNSQRLITVDTAQRTVMHDHHCDRVCTKLQNRVAFQQ